MTFYHAHAAGYTKQFDTLAQVQEWLDGKRAQLAGETLKVWKVIDCKAQFPAIIEGVVSK